MTHMLLQIPNINQTSSLYSCRLSLKSSIESPKPPTTKEEAILQARNSLYSTLKKPLNNTRQTGKFKKLKQPRYRVEIPVLDDSPSSLSQLALEVFGEMPSERKGGAIKILVLWPGEEFTQVANEAFGGFSSNNVIRNLDMRSILDGDGRTSLDSSFDLVVFLAPQLSQVDALRIISARVFPKPVVIFNPQWSFEEEGDAAGFVESFEVVYCFMGLEVRGILSKRKGVIFKCVKDGGLSGEKWNAFVEEDGGEMRVVSSFKTRPSIAQVENVLYNVMAMNSPIAKSSKFLKDLVSNVTGRR